MSSKVVVPQAKEAMEKFKYEVANEIGVPLKQGYNGDLTSAQNGYVGGYMVKKMIERAEAVSASNGWTRKELSHVTALFDVYVLPFGNYL